MTGLAITPADTTCLNCGRLVPCGCTEPMPAADAYAQRRAVADDAPSSIVQQMPEVGEPAPRIWVEPTGYREGWTGIPDQVEPDDVEYIRADIARATEADLRAEVERLTKRVSEWRSEYQAAQKCLALYRRKNVELVAEVERLNALADLRAQHAAWSQAQFGDVSAVGPAKHLAKEATEVAADPLDPIEHADCWMLLWDMQRRAGISDAQLADAIREKLAINQARRWPAPREGEAREHDRADQPEDKA
ncbi:DUF550 domain-containing protein [Paracoccus yeei]|uniref:DUF550 domain-containing protein n=1 Tax=Paracoccus yeei TaxID=147645 RepID=A0A386UJU4_9RHOB|nr:dATP/dGTP pyrophosphohydrolase domain-containing protein [Paracoccus yeei]AYF00420.1 DUF550 domain-containing protein [Paracoccus yeei]AZV00424.1 EaA-like protein [Paracoccus phage vB_PyeM_Pyei1]